MRQTLVPGIVILTFFSRALRVFLNLKRFPRYFYYLSPNDEDATRSDPKQSFKWKRGQEMDI